MPNGARLDDQSIEARTAALYALKSALREATDSGLMDLIANEVHPDCINQFCAEVERLIIKT